MEIRQATINDVDGVMELYATAGAQALCPVPTRAGTARTARKGELFVAIEGGTVLGGVRLDRLQPPEYAQVAWRGGAESGRALVVHALCVAPAARRHGCASELLRFSLERARGCGCAAVRLDVWGSNGAARALYDKLGFIQTGARPVMLGDRADEQLFYERSIT